MEHWIRVYGINFISGAKYFTYLEQHLFYDKLLKYIEKWIYLGLLWSVFYLFLIGEKEFVSFKFINLSIEIQY